MINLIPIEEKKNMRKNFYFRFFVVIFIMLGFCILVLSASILPAYFNSYIKRDVAIQKLESQKKENMPSLNKEITLTIKDLNEKLSLIENFEKNKFLVSNNIIKNILKEKMSDIKITKISYENKSKEDSLIGVYGIAKNRERLLAFRTNLEKNGDFKNIELPISNFIKGSDIEFYLTLMPK